MLVKHVSSVDADMVLLVISAAFIRLLLGVNDSANFWCFSEIFA